jgi:hypothetical protein
MAWPTELVDGARITATVWNAIVRALSTWQGSVNGGGFDLNNGGTLRATSVEAASIKFADNSVQATAATSGGGGATGGATTAGSAPPAGGGEGDEYFEDAPYVWIKQGGVWHPYWPSHYAGAVPPAQQGFSLLNNATGTPATLGTASGALEVGQPVDAGFRSRLLVKDVPSGTGAKTLVAIAAPSLVNSGAHRFGLVVYNAATEKGFCFVNLRNTAWEAFRFTGEVYNAQQFNLANQAIGMGPLWWRLVWAPGTSFVFAVSADGKNYIDLATETESDHVGTPSKWGFFHSPQDAQYPMGYTVYSVLES